MSVKLSFFNRTRATLLFMGLFLLSLGGLMIVAASQTTIYYVDRDLDNYWRTTYDILIRPADSVSPIEEKYGIVEANHLSGIYGGITFEQYELIKSIPGVEVAAPISMIGYVAGAAEGNELTIPSEPGVYTLETTLTANDGYYEYTVPGAVFSPPGYYFLGQSDQGSSNDGSPSQKDNIIVISQSRAVNRYLSFIFLIAGIDPDQEAALVGLDKAVTAGSYLTNDAVPVQDVSSQIIDVNPNLDKEFSTLYVELPILINSHPYVDLVQTAQLKRVKLPPEISTLEGILDHGGNEFLTSLPAEVLATTRTDSDIAYQRMLEFIAPELFGINVLYSEGGLGSTHTIAIPGPIQYEEIQPEIDFNGLILGVRLPENSTELGLPAYRNSVGMTSLNMTGWWDPKGILDIEKLHPLSDVNRVPLETYFPPVAILRFDEQGQPVDPPMSLKPLYSPYGYIQSPPLLLTSIEGARTLLGENAISAVRVRVGDLDELTPASQRKIETVALTIAKLTGLRVDIMVGSSPTRVLAKVPGVGYVEEQWIQKGVNLVYKQGIQTGNWLLLETLLLAGGLFTLDLIWAEALARRRIIALQKALGWYSRTVFTQILGQIMGIGLIATTLGTLIALALIRLLGWESVPLNLLITLPLIVMGLCGIGSLVPAWSASRVPPIAEIQRGGVRYRRRAAGTISGLWSYAWNELKRRTVRSILTGLGSALSAALLTLLLGVTLQQRGMLGGTLLGEFILVNVESYHYAIVGIGLGLAFLSTFNGLLGSILERRREIGVLKAIGWRTASIARLFIAQGLLLGMVGGSFGTLAGSLAFLYFYKSVSPDLALVILLGMSLPGLVGALAALYPARLAAKVPPAEALRYE